MSRLGKANRATSYGAPEVLAIIALVLICLSAIRAGHESTTIPAMAASLAAAVMLIPLAVRAGLHFDRPLFLLVCVLPPLLVVQSTYASPGFNMSWALSAIVLFVLFLGVASAFSSDGRMWPAFWRIINFISLTSSVVILLQYVAFGVGVRLNELPRIGDWVFGAWEFTAAFRPCGPFSEASHFAELSLLSAYYYLYVQKRYSRFLVVALAAVASTSALGILGVLLLVVLHTAFFAFSVGSHRGARAKHSAFISRMVLVATVALCLVSLVAILQGSSSWLATRLLDGGTFSMRVSRSFELFDLMTPMERLYGIGLQNQAIYLDANSIVLTSDANETLLNREYSAAFGYVLCTCGIVGAGFLFASIVTPLVSGVTREQKVFALLFFYVIFTCGIFSRAIFVLWMTAFFLVNQRAAALARCQCPTEVGSKDAD